MSIVRFSAKGGTVSFDVSSNTDINLGVRCDESWINASTASNSKIEINVEANEGEKARNGDVYPIVNGELCKSNVITISQSSKSVVSERFIIDSGQRVEVDGSKTRQQIYLNGNYVSVFSDGTTETSDKYTKPFYVNYSKNETNSETEEIVLVENVEVTLLKSPNNSYNNVISKTYEWNDGMSFDVDGCRTSSSVRISGTCTTLYSDSSTTKTNVTSLVSVVYEKNDSDDVSEYIYNGSSNNAPYRITLRRSACKDSGGDEPTPQECGTSTIKYAFTATPITVAACSTSSTVTLRGRKITTYSNSSCQPKEENATSSTTITYDKNYGDMTTFTKTINASNFVSAVTISVTQFGKCNDGGDEPTPQECGTATIKYAFAATPITVAACSTSSTVTLSGKRITTYSNPNCQSKEENMTSSTTITYNKNYGSATSFTKTISASNLLNPITVTINQGGNCNDGGGEPTDKNYFRIVSLANSNYIYIKSSNSAHTKTISVSTDDGRSWRDVTSSSDGSGALITILDNGNSLLIKGYNSSYGTSDYFVNFKASNNFNVEGNIMSLIYGDDFENNTEITQDYALRSLFGGCSNLIKANNLILPSNRLTNSCYWGMFYNCKHLQDAPELPATIMGERSYEYMFGSCYDLTFMPNLPATTLANGCYMNMFNDCTRITTVSELPATTLVSRCYERMFYKCTNLVRISRLPATTLASSCYNSMFYGCTSLTQAPELPATTMKNYCYQYMFQGCTNLLRAPELPATTMADSCYEAMFQYCEKITQTPQLPPATLVYGCYRHMFSDCTSLRTASVLLASTLASTCYEGMFYNCSSLTTAPELPATTLADNCYNYMFGNCTSLTQAPELPATRLADNCYENMFSGCENLTVAPELPATKLERYCYEGMFNLCRSLRTAPELQATVLEVGCYESMFQGCENLTAAPELLVTELPNSCYWGMFWGCSSLTTAPELPATTLAGGCYSHMFRECTSLTQAHELPAIKLESRCYEGMFNGCTSLTTAPELPATTLADNCCNRMFEGCTSLTTAPKLPATTLAKYCYNAMFSGCTSLNYIKAMFTTNPSYEYTENWVKDVASTGTFVKNTAATWDVTGVNGVPNGWSVETASE